MTPFDVIASPLRDGDRDVVPRPLLIEASAGSGKTWTLAHLAVRFMLEDSIEPDELLLVTFTRDAARELKGRVRGHLIDVIAFLSAGEVDGETRWHGELASRWANDGDRRRDLERARACLADLDGLHARTIHSFAAVNARTPLGSLSDDGRLWGQAFRQVVARWSLHEAERFAQWADHGDLETLDAVARALYDAGVRTSGTSATVRVLPDAPPDGPDELERAARAQRAMALDVVSRFCELLSQEGRTSYADLVVALASRLEHHDAERFVTDLRATYRVVMIDEFQDTDPLQWRVFREIFLDAPETRLILVGDPKQAIYGFRSGGVETFLEVREYCRDHGVPVSTLDRNYRSSPQYVDATNRFFAGADFHYEPGGTGGGRRIGFEEAEAHRFDVDPIFPDLGDGALHLRVAPHSTGEGAPILAEVAAYLAGAHRAGVAYRDMAVLCDRRHECQRVHRYLTRRRIPSVTASEASIFQSAAALHLRLLLVALSSPQEASLTEALRATWFRGVDGADPASSAPGRLITQLAADITSIGVAALTRYLRSTVVLTTVLALRDGERHLTDLAHLSELLARECHGVTSPTLVLDWLETATTGLDVDESTESRRLETESDAVRIMTVHASKGQEFSVVLAPFIARRYPAVSRSGSHVLRRWVADGVTVIDAGSGLSWGDDEERDLRTEAAQAGEERRLIYVALTRARDFAAVWFTTPYQVPFGGEFSRLLFDREVGGAVRNRPLDEVRRTFVSSGWTASRDPGFRSAKAEPRAALEAALGDATTIGIFDIGAALPDGPAHGVGRITPEGARVFAVAPPIEFDYQRRRWSYSDVARDLKERPVTAGDSGEDEVPGYDEADETVDERVLKPESVRDDVAGVFGRLSGKQLGVVVHRVLELAVGSAEPPFADLVTAALREGGLGEGIAAGDLERTRASLERLWRRPLTPTLGGEALGDLRARDVAKEMRFLLSLGDRPLDDRLQSAVAAVVDHDHSGPDGSGLFARYLSAGAVFAQRLTEGYLIGSLDLTVRDREGRYRIVDYKTDQLGGADRPYESSRLQAHMEAEHYPLQALFYSVALHRFLRSRLTSYDPDRHLGGVDYLFVRVVGDGSAASVDGVFTWPITPAAVVVASDALGGHRGS